MRLIDADALNMDIMGRLTIVSPDVAKYANGVMSLIAHAPTIEAEPVRHGRWVCLEAEIGYFACSECDHRILRAKCNYCLNCGAKMDGGADE